MTDPQTTACCSLQGTGQCGCDNDAVIVPRNPTEKMLWRAFMADERRDISFEDFMSLYPGWRADQNLIWSTMIKEANNDGE